MDAKKVKVILKAIERGSLKAAAEENGYTPSGLSHLLQNLEEELGVTLAERNNRGIAWSREGSQLAPFFRDFVQAYQILLREAENLREEAEAVVHIAAYASIAKSWMPGLVSEFRKNYPKVKVDIQVQGRQELYRNMANGRWNMIFACYDETCHLILEAPHPSPLSAYRGFFGSKPFSQTNKFLEAHGVEPIDWQIDEL